MESTLIGGPQDGAKVEDVGGYLPPSLYVGPKCLGDGYAAWADKKSKRFPSHYAHKNSHRGVHFSEPS